ncbi:MAG TPA: 50S ribosomal protein L16 [Symbiobacteriaceae bacterium]
MLAPKRVKWRKPHKAVVKMNRGRAKGGTTVTSGEYGLQALEPAFVSDRQIEAARVAITRCLKRGGKVWVKIFPDRAMTKKPAETRMGSGKGTPEYWVAVVKPGRVMFEVAGVSEDVAREALRLASHKLPVKCRFVKREETGVVTAETGGEAQ